MKTNEDFERVLGVLDYSLKFNEDLSMVVCDNGYNDLKILSAKQCRQLHKIRPISVRDAEMFFMVLPVYQKREDWF